MRPHPRLLRVRPVWSCDPSGQTADQSQWLTRALRHTEHVNPERETHSPAACPQWLRPRPGFSAEPRDHPPHSWRNQAPRTGRPSTAHGPSVFVARGPSPRGPCPWHVRETWARLPPLPGSQHPPRSECSLTRVHTRHPIPQSTPPSTENSNPLPVAKMPGPVCHVTRWLGHLTVGRPAAWEGNASPLHEPCL